MWSSPPTGLPKVTRKDYSVALNGTGSGVDDPDQHSMRNYGGGVGSNYTRVCTPELDKELEPKTAEAQEKPRGAGVWQIDRSCGGWRSADQSFTAHARDMWRRM